MKQQKKKKGRSVQELLGIKTFTKYGLSTNKGELLFYLVSPTNMTSCITTSAQRLPTATKTENCSKKNYGRERKSTNSS